MSSVNSVRRTQPKPENWREVSSYLDRISGSCPVLKRFQRESYFLNVLSTHASIFFHSSDAKYFVATSSNIPIVAGE